MNAGSLLTFSFLFYLVQNPSLGDGAAHSEGGSSQFSSLSQDNPSPTCPELCLQGDFRSCPGDSQSKPSDGMSSLKLMRFQAPACTWWPASMIPARPPPPEVMTSDCQSALWVARCSNREGLWRKNCRDEYMKKAT